MRGENGQRQCSGRGDPVGEHPCTLGRTDRSSAGVEPVVADSGRLGRFVGAVALVLALVGFVTPRAGSGQGLGLGSPLVDREEITVDAQEITYDQKTDTIVARGAVVIRRGDTELRAEEVRLNRTTNEAEAHGGVILSDPEGTIFAEAIRLNFDEETGILEGAQMQLQRNQYSLRGDVIEKGFGQSFRIENGEFTTCQCDEGPPSWSISGEDLAVTLGGYGTLKSGTFNILDIPVLYIPRAIFPVQLERQSGFLIPQVGVSNRRGFQLLMPFYWAISKSQDATIGFDLETNARVGIVGEYRYALRRGARGVIDAAYFNDAMRSLETEPGSDSVVPRDRWSVLADIEHGLGESSRGFVDAFLVGDDQFLRDMNTYAFDYRLETAIRTLPFTKSQAGFVHEWQRALVKGKGVYYQNLTGPESTTLQKAPEIDLAAQTAWSPFLLGDLAAGGVYFERESGVTGFRLDIQPAATVPLPLGRYAFGSVRAAGRETAYFLTDPNIEGASFVGTPEVLPRDQSRELVEVRADVGTALSRVYSLKRFGLEKLRHSIEPALAYLYVPDVSQVDLPLFDGVDRVNQRNLFTYGLSSRIVGKFEEEVALHTESEEGVEPAAASSGRPQATSERYREIARFSLMQSVDVLRDIDPLQAGRPADHFSDIDFGGRINPARVFSLRFAGSYDTLNNDLSAARVGFFFEEPWSTRRESVSSGLETRTSAGVSYRLITPNILQEVDSNVVVRLTDWAGLLYASRYDVSENQFLNNYWGVRFVSTCDCWAIDIAIEDRSNPQEVEVRVQVTLVGLGSGMPKPRVAAMPW
jgi:LPS-assembly protein